MAAQFCYGRREGALVHASDLEAAEDRGLLCACDCPQCGRPLQAHLGEQKAWHFQHHVEDANCEPQPMTLLHAFVRDELALRRELRIPGKMLRLSIEALGKTWHQNAELPAQVFEVVGSKSEARVGDVQPDVLYRLRDETTLALEVRYTHAVDEEKRCKLRWSCTQAVEFDVSDLPATGIGRRDLERLLGDGGRWTWLVNTAEKQSEVRLRDQVTWLNQRWTVRERPSYHVSPAAPASAKLRKAQSRMPWAREQLGAVKAQHLNPEAAARWLGEQDKVDRVAVACAALGLEPSGLPEVFSQAVSNGLGHHPYSWQVVVYMKFGIGALPFDAHEAARWSLLAMPDRVERFPDERSLNGFNRTAAALHSYFLSLAAQGLLTSKGEGALEDRTFLPRFRSAGELHAYLGGSRARSSASSASRGSVAAPTT